MRVSEWGAITLFLATRINTGFQIQQVQKYRQKYRQFFSLGWLDSTHAACWPVGYLLALRRRRFGAGVVAGFFFLLRPVGFFLGFAGAGRFGAGGVGSAGAGTAGGSGRSSASVKSGLAVPHPAHLARG